METDRNRTSSAIVTPDWKALLAALVDNGFACTNDEMGDTFCFYCDDFATKNDSLGYGRADSIKHADDCPWLVATRFLASDSGSDRTPG